LKRSNRLVLLIGIFLAVVAFVLILVSLGGGTGTTTETQKTTLTVVVAARDIPLSTKITAADVKTKEIPIESKPADYFGDTSQVIGQTARQPVLADQLITSAVTSGSGTANITVPAGYVGVSLLVDQTTGVGTLIKSGDYVDVVMGITGADKVPVVEFFTPVPTATPRGNATPAPAPTSSAGYTNTNIPYNPTTVKVLAEGLQVIGTLLPPPPAQTGNTTGTTTTGTTDLNTNQQEMVIVAATIQQAEVMKFAQMQGDISLVLRATSDCQDASGQATPCPITPTTGITLRVLVDDYGVLPPQIIQVIQPTPLPNVLPSGHPAVVPSPSPSPLSSTTP
jgi:Flp pilus assembly protein CpaB